MVKSFKYVNDITRLSGLPFILIYAHQMLVNVYVKVMYAFSIKFNRIERVQ